MKVSITLKNTSHFTLENVIHFGLMKHMYEGKKRRIMFFHDETFGTLVYPLADIAEICTDNR